MKEADNIADNLFSEMQDRFPISKEDAERFVSVFFSTLSDSLIENGSVIIKNFASFEIAKEKEKTELLFTPSDELSKSINGPFSAFAPTPIYDDGIVSNLEIEKGDIENYHSENLSQYFIVENESNNKILTADLSKKDLLSPQTEESIADSKESENQLEETNSETLSENANDLNLPTVSKESQFVEDNDDEKENSISVIQDKKNEKKALKSIALSIIFLGVVVLAYVLFSNSKQKINSSTPKKKETSETLPTNSVIPSDAKDSLSNKNISDNDNHQSEKSYQIQKGETLRILAEKFFFNREFWPYIYLENKDLIKNPNRLDKNIVIKIPDAKKYFIEPQNPNSIEKAKILGDSILNKY